jgi:hypothetical protein
MGTPIFELDHRHSPPPAVIIDTKLSTVLSSSPLDSWTDSCADDPSNDGHIFTAIQGAPEGSLETQRCSQECLIEDDLLEGVGELGRRTSRAESPVAVHSTRRGPKQCRGLGALHGERHGLMPVGHRMCPDGMQRTSDNLTVPAPQSFCR